MSSLDNIYQKLAPKLEPASPSHLPEAPSDQSRLIGRHVAHDLNNVLTIIQGYGDRLLLKHGENPELRAELQLISENARRAVSIIRQATPRKSSERPLPILPS